MKNFLKNFMVVSLAVSAGLTVAESARAHHSFAMFDRSRELLLPGVVVRWAFNSPHIALVMTTEDGTQYSFEGAAPPSLLSRTPAMNGFTFQPGQKVQAVFCPLHDGRPGGAIGFIIDAEGIFYSPNDGGCGPSQDWKQWVAAGYSSRAQAEAAE